MSLGLISILALFVAIAIGFLRNSNVGILCIGLSLLIGIIYKVDAKEIIGGFSSSLCLTMVGVTYLFSILTGNKTLELFANKIVRLVGKYTYLIYVAMYVVGFILCAVGPGAIPMLALMPILAVPVALSSGINPILLSLVGQLGVQSGRMTTSITPEGVLVTELMGQQGLNMSLTPLMWCLIISEFVLLVFIFIYFKGWKIEKPLDVKDNEIGKEKFNSKQIISLIGLAGLIIGVLVFDLNVGLLSFLIGSVLIAIGVGNEQQSIKSIPWNVILMVLGVGILMNIVVVSGGIDIMSKALQSIMNQRTASAIMTAVAGIMSFFSLGLGVVFPTLIPTASSIASSIGGVNPVELVAAVVVGGTITGYSPISTTGSLLMAAVLQEDKYKDKYNEKTMFVQLFVVAIAGLVISSLVALLGIFSIFC